jgi:hypothetical protein
VRVLHVIAIVEPGGGSILFGYYNRLKFYRLPIVFPQRLVAVDLVGFLLCPGSLI